MDITAAVALLAEHPDEAICTAGTVLLRALGCNACGHAARIAERDRLLRETGLLSTPARLASALRRYRSSAWLRERTLAQCPHPTASLQSLLWQVLKLVDRGIGERQMKRILDKSTT